MLSSTLPQSILSASRACSRRKAVAAVVPRLLSSDASRGHVDPMAVFDSIDTNGDGVLSKEEFSMAVEKMHYTDLLKIKDSLSRNELSFNPSADEEKSLEATNASILGRRSIVTAEVSNIRQSLCYHSTFLRTMLNGRIFARTGGNFEDLSCGCVELKLDGAIHTLSI